MDNNELLSQLSQLMDNKLDTLRSEMAEVVDDKINGLRAELQAQEQRLDAKLNSLRTEMKDENQKLLMSIVDVVESQATKLGMQYEHEIAGKINALNEETDVIRSDVKEHEQRIYTVERKVGLAI